MLRYQSIELPGSATFVAAQQVKSYGRQIVSLFSACAEGTLKLVIAKAMTKLDVGVAEVERSPPTKLSSAVARGRF
ncbi:MAG: hypothetical protein ACOYBR_03005 [Fluviibacter sp.]